MNLRKTYEEPMVEMNLQTELLLIFGTLVLLGISQAQIPAIPPSNQRTFYLNKKSDCDGSPREVGQDTSYIFGVTSEAQAGKVLSCTITLNSENAREPNRFKIQFLSIDIRDPNVFFYIYDGEFNGRQLWAFSQNKKKPNDLDYDFSTGQRVSFRLTRGELDFDFDIRLVVIPVPSDVQRCVYGHEYGCDDYGYNYRVLGTKEIAAIIGGGFALVVVIVVIVVICCYRKQRGISRKWKEETLGSVNTAASIHSLNGKVNKDHNNPKPWTSESSKAEFASIRRSPKLPRVSVTRHVHAADRDRDRDSAFGSSESIPRKRQPLPSYSRKDPRDYRDRDYRDRDYRDRDRDHRDRDRGYRERDRDYDRESDRSNLSDRPYKPPTYREALRHDHSGSSSELGDATEHSFVQADDDHPQKTFIERVITPRVKPGKKSSPAEKKRVIPPPEEDLTYDSIEPKKSKIAEVQKNEESETEESDTSNTDNESEESEEETESEEEHGAIEVDKPDAKDVYSKVNKNKEKEAKGGPQGAQPPQGQGFMYPQQGFMPPPQNMQGPGYPGYFPPGVHHPQPRYGYPAAQVPPYQGHVPPQGQGMPPQNRRPDPYSQASFTVPINQPGAQFPSQGPPPRTQYNAPPQNRQPGQGHRPNNKPSMSHQPNNPPIYSYLVNRGYQPIEGRQSPVSTSTGGTNLSGDRNMLVEDSDFSANLDSGVELLKR